MRLLSNSVNKEHMYVRGDSPWLKKYLHSFNTFFLSCWLGENGEKGIPGPEGPQGPQGQRGPQGPRLSGVSYNLWGRTNCSGDATVVYTGKDIENDSIWIGISFKFDLCKDAIRNTKPVDSLENEVGKNSKSKKKNGSCWVKAWCTSIQIQHLVTLTSVIFTFPE